jgi:hypothetical protein
MRLVTVLLILVMAMTLASFPAAESQVSTTITNLSTATTVVSQASYSTNTIGLTTASGLSTNTFASDTLTLQAGNARFCFFNYFNVTIDPGTTEILGSIGPPSTSFDFYIMNQAQYAEFNHSECGETHAAVVSKYAITSIYDLDWKNPSPGWYYFIFSEPDVKNPTVTIPFIIWATLGTVSTSTLFATQTNQIAVTEAQTYSQVLVTQVSNAFAILPIWVIGIIVVLILGAMLYFLFRWNIGRRNVERGTKRRLICKECGNALPARFRYCNKCGALQD